MPPRGDGDGYAVGNTPVRARNKWAPLGIPLSLVLVGLAFRLAGEFPGWGTLLIVGGIIGVALTAYTVNYGSHERTLDRESIRTADDAKW